MVLELLKLEDTKLLGEKLAKLLCGNDIILLNGDLGAGKTTLVKQVAKALGINENVTSPTFTLLKTYKASKFTLVHVDAYRLDGQTFEEIEDYLNSDNVIFIEWSECLANQEFLNEYLSIDITYIDEETRTFTITAKGKRYENLLGELENENIIH